MRSVSGRSLLPISERPDTLVELIEGHDNVSRRSLSPRKQPRTLTVANMLNRSRYGLLICLDKRTCRDALRLRERQQLRGTLAVAYVLNRSRFGSGRRTGERAETPSTPEKGNSFEALSP
ncbi:hypothetical protein AVEN_176201-1 [Araneus ventricosus]|uniref:Uncharacterized protein n=1 Tax=Araneus ventricosus TaxID=182803 RepID=A0A4Y2W470_ARAVE|nr:hypothetical protein AVEN_176201-1 [Araneus ventricosus]